MEDDYVANDQILMKRNSIIKLEPCNSGYTTGTCCKSSVASIHQRKISDLVR